MDIKNMFYLQLTPQKLFFKRLNEVESDPEAFNWYLFNYHFKDELQRKYHTAKTCSPTDHAADEFLNYPG